MANITYECFINYNKIKDLVHLITEKQKQQIEKLSDVYTTKTIRNRLESIRQFILCEVDEHWLARLRIIQRKLKTDVISEYACRIRYGDKWVDKRNDLIKRVIVSEENFIRRFGKEEGERRWKEFRNLKTYGLKHMVERYGEAEGKRRWDKALSQKVNTMQERKKIKPYRNGLTLREYQDRFGEEEGLAKWTKRCENTSYRASKQYYVDTFGEAEGSIKWAEYCKNMDKTSLKSFINREGEEIGTQKYNEFVKKLKYIRTKEYFIEKYGEERGIEEYNILAIKRKFKTIKYSKISQELFWEIHSKYDGKEDMFFAELNEEYLIYVFNDNFMYIELDFMCGDKVIEFDGDYWHDNEKRKEKDRLRDEYLISNGYQVLRIKESEYKKDKEKIINECLLFLKKY